MLSIFDLPTEILSQIVRYVNLNGDLAELRSSNSNFVELSSHQSRFLFEDLCIRYSVSPQTAQYLLSKDHGKPFTNNEFEPNKSDILRWTYFLHKTEILGSDADQAMSHTLPHKISRLQLSSREPFVLFASLTRLLNSSLTTSHSTASDVLAPSPDGGQYISKRFSERFVKFLGPCLTLEELEAIIAGISVCVAKLWSSVFMFRPKDSTISGFGSLSGASFSTDQAILTEHVIWRGPIWVAKILERFGSGDNFPTYAESSTKVDDVLVKEGVWKGSREDGARLAANGVARLLWKERQRKIEAKGAASADKVSIVEMRVNASVWRGSAGDI